MKFTKVSYTKLNARQGELQFSKNLRSASGIRFRYLSTLRRLGGCGFDWCALLRIGSSRAIESRLTFEKKYLGNELYVAFAAGESWYLYPHDELLSQVLDATNIGSTDSWESGIYSWPRLSKQLEKMLAPYCITGDTRPWNSGPTKPWQLTAA